MNAPATTVRGTAARLVAGVGLVTVLLTGAVGAAPAGASVPAEHDGCAPRTRSSIVYVNGIHTMAGTELKFRGLS